MSDGNSKEVGFINLLYRITINEILCNDRKIGFNIPFLYLITLYIFIYGDIIESGILAHVFTRSDSSVFWNCGLNSQLIIFQKTERVRNVDHENVVAGYANK